MNNELELISCPVCEKIFEKTTYNKKYCSNTCREIKEKEKYKYEKILNCPVCKKNFIKQNKKFRIYCSQECFKNKNREKNNWMTSLRKILLSTNEPNPEKVFKLTGASSKSELLSYFESKFKEGMTWENYGWYGWHIDHIRPCSSFDLTNSEELKKCFHYTNLQPLWGMDNMSKGNKLPDELQKNQ
jgi:predicted nucleic acid-binding Zn ribbon protein